MAINSLKGRIRFFKARQKTLEQEEGRTSPLYTEMIKELTALYEIQSEYWRQYSRSNVSSI